MILAVRRVRVAPVRRQAAGGRGWRPPKRAVFTGVAAAVLALVMIAAVLSSSGHSGEKSASTSASAGVARSASVGSGSGSGNGSGSGSGVAAAAPTANQVSQAQGVASNGGLTSGGSSADTGSSPNMVPALPSLVIKTASLTLQVAQGHLADAMGRLSALASGVGGYVASSTQSSTAATVPDGDITLRVPVTQFDSALSQVKNVGAASSVTVTGQDVTSQYVDLQARLTSLQDERSQFQQILTKAQSIGDILAVEQQITDLQTQIEQLQGQIKVLGDETSYSTLTVHVQETPRAAVVPPPKKPASGLSKAWDRARRSFAHGVEAVVAASGGLAVFLIFVGLVLLVIRVGWGLARRRLV